MAGTRTIGIEERLGIEACALDAGFDLAGVAAVEEPESAEAELARQRFTDWVEAGHAGEMEYLKRADEAGDYLRGHVRLAMPWARSVLVCAVNYNAEAPRSIDPASPTSGWIARYAWSGRETQDGNDGMAGGSDYHDVLLVKLKSVESKLREQFGADFESRCYVDTGPLVERGYAARAGIGWIAKNTCVIHQGTGSWLLLGVIVTSLELEKEATVAEAADRCGSCTRCIDACPTDALFLPTPEAPTRRMDASRCIAYLTIEKKGEIAEELRPLMGRQVFGCDICQDVCPWNRKAPVASVSGMPVRTALINPDLEWLAAMEGATFNQWFRGSPLERTRRKRLLRNVAIAMGNSGDTTFVPRLQKWAVDDDAVLADAAKWSLGRLQSL